MASLLLATILAGASVAAGQSPATGKTPGLRAADKAFRAGYAAVQRSDFRTAESDFAEVVRLSPGNATGHAAYGSVLLSLGKVRPAIRELERAHTLDPEETSAPQNLARAYQLAGENGKAKDVLGGLAQKHASMTPEAWYAYAQLLLEAGDSAGARDRMIEATEAYPDNALLQDTLGVVLATEQEYSRAEQHFRQAIALDAKLAQAHLHLGTTLLLEKRAAAAVPVLQLAAEWMPGDADAHLQLGRALTANHEDPAAIGALQEALRLVGHETSSPSATSELAVEIKYALALALQNAGRNADSLPLFEDAAAARPKDAAVLTNLGLALVETGKATRALVAYNQALALDANNWILQQDMGVAYLQQSDLNHAIEHFQSGLILAPGNAQLHYDLGLAYKLKDNLPEAIAAFTLAEAEDASLADPPYTLGVLYMQSGRFAEAQTQLQKATTLRPENGDAWSVLGSVDKSLDQAERAIADLKMAIQLQPLLPGNHVTLAAVYAHQNRHDDAASERRIAAELSRAAVGKQRSAFALDSARALLKQGHLAEAVTQLRAAIAAEPENEAAHRELAEALQQQGDVADAAVERQKATSLAAP